MLSSHSSPPPLPPRKSGVHLAPAIEPDLLQTQGTAGISAQPGTPAAHSIAPPLPPRSRPQTPLVPPSSTTPTLGTDQPQRIDALAETSKPDLNVTDPFLHDPAEDAVETAPLPAATMPTAEAIADLARRTSPGDSMVQAEVPTTAPPGQAAFSVGPSSQTEARTEPRSAPPVLPPRPDKQPQSVTEEAPLAAGTSRSGRGVTTWQTNVWLSIITFVTLLHQYLPRMIVIMGVMIPLYVLLGHIPDIDPAGSSSTDPRDPEDTRENKRETVDWVNHALYALFPLISTDVLTPFVDLLEDALMQQVPPIVTSVRLDSPALGSQPLLLTSMRAMSDEEWFAAISAAGPSRTAGPKPLKTGVGMHRRGPSSASWMSSELGEEGSLGSAAEVTLESQRRRKRDRILDRVSRRRRQSVREMNEALDERDLACSGTNMHTTPGKDEDDEENGQYVNYRVGFEYRRTEQAKKKGYGLHVLAHFGWGIKGVGTSEIPVYIDMLGIKGTLNIRLLLSATPPFAKSATISFPSLPEFDISAKPLTRSAFNAMEIPGMKSFVQASIADVAGSFVRPESYTIDIDRLLLGREAALRTHAVGVMQIVIHSAEDLPRTDTLGTTDPYLVISFSKFHKPIFSTRTIIDDRNPIWEETAFILITDDAIQSGERLRLRISDSDRFTADDAIGVVEVDLADLVDETSRHGMFEKQKTELQAERPGFSAKGSLIWSVRFCPLWQMPPEQLRERHNSMQQPKKGEPTNLVDPWWLQAVRRFAGDAPEWEQERKERRKEALAWITGEKERDEMEAAEKPTDAYRSGVLQFHIHQCSDLEVESLDGTYSSDLTHRTAAAHGKPALVDIVDKTAAENQHPPSSYCEVILNDKLVYRTRTKQVTPLPYFNAVSERFIRDWTMAKVTFAVRDERDREHDPLLGLVNLPLAEVFKERSQVTKWYPLVGGLGWGRIRISLLWKPIDVQLSPRVSGYEVATLRIGAFEATDLSKYTDKDISVMLETEADRHVLSGDLSSMTATGSRPSSIVGSPKGSIVRSPSGQNNQVGSPGLSPLRRALSARNQSAASLGQGVASSPFQDPMDGDVLEDLGAGISAPSWELKRPIRLAVQYRHSSSVVISFMTKSAVLKKKKVIGLAMLRLSDITDDEDVTRSVPIWHTESVKEAVKASQVYEAMLAKQASSSGSTDAASVPQRMTTAQGTTVIGHITMTLTLHPGVSRAHRRLAKRDLRFLHVYEAWEEAKALQLGVDQISVKDQVQKGKQDIKEAGKDALGIDDDGSSSSDSDDDGHSSDEFEGGSAAAREDRTSGIRRTRTSKSARSTGTTGTKGELNDEDDLEAEYGRRAHSHALHKRHKGIFQLKIARTGRFVKDQLSAKLHARSQDPMKRPRGADLEVEHEGLSSI